MRGALGFEGLKEAGQGQVVAVCLNGGVGWFLVTRQFAVGVSGGYFLTTTRVDSVLLFCYDINRNEQSIRDVGLYSESIS